VIINKQNFAADKMKIKLCKEAAAKNIALVEQFDSTCPSQTLEV